MEEFIKKCETFLLKVPLKGKYVTAHGEVSLHKSVVVIIETNEGHVGYGQVDPIPRYSNETAEEVYFVIKRLITPILIGKSPFAIDSIMASIDNLFPSYVHLESRAAINIALYDLLGKITNRPVYSLLGELHRKEIPVVGWVGSGRPEEMANNAIKRLEEGYKCIKIKITGDYNDVERIRTVREAIGYNVELRVDANESIIPIDIIKKLERYELKWIEQPAPRRSIEYLTKIKKETEIPILIDESISDLWSLIDVIKKGVADYVKLKVMKQGGISAIKKMIDICKAENIKFTIGHGFDMGISALAELHVISISEQIEEVNEVGGPNDKINDDIIHERLEFMNGSYKINDNPGLGITVDKEKLKKYSESY